MFNDNTIRVRHLTGDERIVSLRKLIVSKIKRNEIKFRREVLEILISVPLYREFLSRNYKESFHYYVSNRVEWERELLKLDFNKNWQL